MWISDENIWQWMALTAPDAWVIYVALAFTTININVHLRFFEEHRFIYFGFKFHMFASIGNQDAWGRAGST
ncbi:MAG: hypothetical protein OEZ02_03200 [Anaerolineae bacterium]|nr:hypothetical protein [Anaerolineae bacterium]